MTASHPPPAANRTAADRSAGRTASGSSAADRLLLRLEWRVLRRLAGRVPGGYRTAHRGAGTDLAGLRGYVAGDDARRIDWNVTARTNEPQLRVFNEDRELTVWLVLDRSASMAVGAHGRGKREVLSELALLVARLFTGGGNQVGALLYDNGAMRAVPPGAGRGHVLRIAAELDRVNAAPADGGAGNGGRRTRRRSSRPADLYRGTTNLAAMLDAAGRLARRRSLIVVVSDFIGAGDWERSLLRLGPRHEVVALHVVDKADEELPDAGLLVVEDTETGEQLVLDSGDPLLRASLRAAVTEREAALSAGMRRAGVAVHRVETTADLATVLVKVVTDTRRRRP